MTGCLLDWMIWIHPKIQTIQMSKTCYVAMGQLARATSVNQLFWEAIMSYDDLYNDVDEDLRDQGINPTDDMIREEVQDRMRDDRR